ncbi:JmjC domain protein [Thermoascus aurantiacus ATCC 26904]
MRLQQWIRARGNPLGWNLPRPNYRCGRHHALGSRSTHCATPRYSPLDTLHDANIDRFRQQYFKPGLPVILPRGYFRELPARNRWFARTSTSSEANASRLNYEYLEQYGDAFVPLELTRLSSVASTAGSSEKIEHFQRFHAPLSLFLEWTRSTQTQFSRLYLAQCQLLDLPQALRDDFPTPSLVLQAGRGDIYDTNVWIGIPPTYTPLHRDPNPNLFVQLAGEKRVRLHAPDIGMGMFARVRQELGQAAGHDAAVFRGEEMMQGQERELLERAVWGDDGASPNCNEGFEAHLEAGDGLFIPKGWWHSIKGVGTGITASVNWWFR